MTPYKQAKDELLELFETREKFLRPHLRPFARMIAEDLPVDTADMLCVIYDAWTDGADGDWVGVGAFLRFRDFYYNNQAELLDGCRRWDS